MENFDLYSHISSLKMILFIGFTALFGSSGNIKQRLLYVT
jgi:hypothetical protein